MIFTNGRRITPELADLFARVPPLLPIEITVYGMSDRAYESVSRVPGSHSEFLEGLSELSRRHIPFVVKWADLAPNREEFAAFCAWAKGLPAMTKPPAVVRILQLRDRRDDPQRNRMIAGLRQTPPAIAALLADPASRERRELVRFCRQFLGPQGDRLFACGFGEVPCIDAYGRLQPCLGIRSPELSFNLATGGIREALERFFPPLRGTTATNPEYLKRCARCFLRGLCEQCPARSWTEHGTLDTPVEYFCEVAHQQARQLGLLADNERGWETADWQLRISHMISIAKNSIP
jgi:radical SAM protein with 4Fe4S-binding SPASM domain